MTGSDPQRVARQLEGALRTWRTYLERDGGFLDPALVALEELALYRVSAGQGGPLFDGAARVADDQPVTVRALTLAHVAESVGVSVSTVKRLIRAGDLRSVQIAGARRVLADDLDAYLGTLSPQQNLGAA